MTTSSKINGPLSSPNPLVDPSALAPQPFVGVEEEKGKEQVKAEKVTIRKEGHDWSIKRFIRNFIHLFKSSTQDMVLQKNPSEPLIVRQFAKQAPMFNKETAVFAQKGKEDPAQAKGNEINSAEGIDAAKQVKELHHREDVLKEFKTSEAKFFKQAEALLNHRETLLKSFPEGSSPQYIEKYSGYLKAYVEVYKKNQGELQNFNQKLAEIIDDPVKGPNEKTETIARLINSSDYTKYSQALKEIALVAGPESTLEDLYKLKSEDKDLKGIIGIVFLQRLGRLPLLYRELTDKLNPKSEAIQNAAIRLQQETKDLDKQQGIYHLKNTFSAHLFSFFFEPKSTVADANSILTMQSKGVTNSVNVLREALTQFTTRHQRRAKINEQLAGNLTPLQREGLIKEKKDLQDLTQGFVFLLKELNNPSNLSIKEAIKQNFLLHPLLNEAFTTIGSEPPQWLKEATENPELRNFSTYMTNMNKEIVFLAKQREILTGDVKYLEKLMGSTKDKPANAAKLQEWQQVLTNSKQGLAKINNDLKDRLPAYDKFLKTIQEAGQGENSIIKDALKQGYKIAKAAKNQKTFNAQNPVETKQKELKNQLAQFRRFQNNAEAPLKEGQDLLKEIRNSLRFFAQDPMGRVHSESDSSLKKLLDDARPYLDYI